MLNKEKIEKIIKISLIADSYSLGAHWVYDAEQLQKMPIDWNSLNAPQSLWHKGKKAGDFTHIGDQTYWLYEFLQDKKSFDAQMYLAFWQEKMQNYDGYIDGATRETLENLKANIMSGSSSHDFSVVGRIFPLLLVSSSQEEFISNVQDFVKLSHDNEKVIEVATFFAKLILHVKKDESIKKSILTLSNEFSHYIQTAIKEALNSVNQDSFDAIREFGPACDVDEGFRGSIHLLVKYEEDIKELLIQNAKAGGDSSSRAMVAAAVLIAKGSIDNLPSSWHNINI